MSSETLRARLWHLIRNIPFEWLPAIGLTMTVPVIMAALLLGDPRPAPYRPIEPRGLTILSSLIVPQGGEITIQDGLCNKTKAPLPVMVTFTFQEAQVSTITAREVTVIENRLITLEPGCQYGEPISGRLPPEVGAGVWKINALIIAMGPNSGQLQRVTLTSQPFSVVAP